MTIISKRQMNYRLGNVPDIILEDQEYVIISIRDYIPLMNLLITELKHKYQMSSAWSSYSVQDIIIAVEQTIYYLSKNNLIIKDRTLPKYIELWTETIDLGPAYEGICNGLYNALIKLRYKNMYDQIHKGVTVDHWNLTTIKNSVEYTLEWFKREGWLIENGQK